MKELQQWAAVQELYKRQTPIKRIARLLGMSKNTVKKLIRLAEEPKYHRDFYATKIDAYKEQIIVWRCEPYNFNGTRIFRELKLLGYTGSIGPVYYYLKELDEDVGHISSKATVRVETPVGDQAQFDWSEYDIVINNRHRKVYCFSLILAASRKKAICFSLKADAEAIYEAIQELFGDLGGVTLELLIDNPKALVTENNPKSEDEIRYNPEALLLAKHLGIELNACPCYWPRKKGKVERPFQYIEEQFVKGNSFATMEELNSRGKKFIDQWNNEINTTTKRVPNMFYELEERQVLGALPTVHYYLRDLETRKVSSDCMISYKANKYSVPCRYVGKQVQCRLVYGYRLLVYDLKGMLICTWEINDDKYNTLQDPDHYAEIAPRTSTSIPQLRRDFTRIFKHGQAYLESAERSSEIQQPTHHAKRIMEMLDFYEADVLDGFIAYAIEHDCLTIKKFKALVKQHTKDIKAPQTAEASNVGATVSSRHCDESGWLRNCSYYEDIAKEVIQKGGYNQ